MPRCDHHINPCFIPTKCWLVWLVCAEVHDVTTYLTPLCDECLHDPATDPYMLISKTIEFGAIYHYLYDFKKDQMIELETMTIGDTWVVLLQKPIEPGRERTILKKAVDKAMIARLEGEWVE